MLVASEGRLGREQRGVAMNVGTDTGESNDPASGFEERERNAFLCFFRNPIIFTSFFFNFK